MPRSFLSWLCLPCAVLMTFLTGLDCLGQASSGQPIPPTISTNQVFARRPAKLVFPNGAIIPAGAPLRVVAEVEPDAQKVSFFVDRVPIGTATNAPFEVTWSTSKPGVYDVTVIVVYPAAGPRLAVASKGVASAAPLSLRVEDAGTGLCIVEASADLKRWKAISTNQVTDSILQFNDPDAARHQQRFYRVRQF